MDQVLSKGVRERPTPTKRRYSTKADPLQFSIDVDQANVDETVKFQAILVNNSRREIVRLFFSLLFLYARAFIDIWMDDEGVIWLKLQEPPKVTRKRRTTESSAPEQRITK